ncbi:MAG: hypothetical protein A2202_00330 [Bdellovibrionales bacterium RIFOXYA1_FULL_36_14]|nr:MAG: hypothetical protein A2202_00330 [Bdellovibrionales bacterium RIFOXYA1_FULL_36_14]
MKYYLILFIFIGFIGGPTHLQANEILNILDGKTEVNFKDIKVDDPLYPPMILVDLLKKSKVENPALMIEKLEAILHTKDFSNHILGKLAFSKNTFIVGTADSFRLWRELLYICLGRAYYENNDPQKAILYLKGIPDDSPFYSIARLELGWAYIKGYQLKELLKLINELKSKTFNQLPLDLKNELALLNAYYLVSIKDYNEAIKLAESFNLNHDDEQSNLQNKLLAEAWFGKYLQELNDLDFDNKIKLLTRIIDFTKNVDEKYYDAEFAFLAGETNWHLASVYRVLDPDKYKDVWWKHLVRAQEWMEPFINKSINDNIAYVSEEAMFFSIALLWEMAKFNEASERLIALPSLFPQGEYLEDVYQMLGDYHYDEKRFEQAIHYYDKLTQHGQEDKTAYGVYKAAWSFYNLDKKWTALRHLERLYIHYINEADQEPEEKRGLFREVREDLLSLMAELLDWDKGLEEVEIFGETNEKKLKFKADLALSYNKIGKYDYAVNIWLQLLKRNYVNSDSPKWLASIGKAYLAASKKPKIAEVFNTHLKLVINAHNDKAILQELDEEISKIILTVHKEAKKSDTQEDWLAVDRLYKIYEINLPDSTNAKMWYYGAQRYESLSNLWQAISWYKKAAMIKNYENFLDAAHSVIRITSGINDQLSLSITKLSDRVKEYHKIVEISKWYIEEFPKEESRKLAEFVHVEALFHKKDPQGAANYIAERFNNPKADIETSWNLYLSHNKRLYSNQEWVLTNELAEKIFLSIKKLKEEWANNLAKIYQESAFQAAYLLEKKENIAIDEIIKWYHKSCYRKHHNYFDINLSLRSWHNLFAFSLEHLKYDDFQKQLDLFKQVAEIQTADSFDNKNLLFNIHNMAAKFHTKTNEFYSKAQDYFSAAQFTSEKAEGISLVWDAMIIFASYHDEKNFLACLEIISSQMPSFIKTTDRQIILSRLYYYLKDFNNAWNSLKPFIQKELDTKTALLFLDIYTKSKDLNSKVFQEMEDEKKKMHDTWIKSSYFSHLWAFDHEKEYDTLITEWTQTNNRLPAFEKNTLKVLVENVKKELTDLTTIKEKMEKALLPHAPQISVKVFCAAEVVTSNTIKNLKQIGKYKLEDPQWAQFILMLEQKIQDLEKDKAKEQELCEAQKINYQHYPHQLTARIPCMNSICFKDESSTIDILKYEKKQKTKDIIARVEGYLQIGAHSRAEYLISDIKDTHKASFLMGMVRLAQGDTTNAAMIFKTLAKEKEYTDKSELYLKYIASINSYTN